VEKNSPDMAGSYRVLNFTMEQIQQCALDLCEVLQFEFIFTVPCQQLETAIEEVLAQFRYKEILMCNEVCCCVRAWYHLS
jgi:glycerol-3-phosphate O-acyltransferase